MANINEKRYPNLQDAVAFQIAFEQMVYTYDDIYPSEHREECPKCYAWVQKSDVLAPKSNCRKYDGAILHDWTYGVSDSLRKSLIENFDITEADFRPCRNMSGDIVFYQITPTHTMLPMAQTCKYRQLEPCPNCGAVQYRRRTCKNKGGFYYAFISKEALEDMHDLNVTYERFNRYYPEWVVSKRVFEYFSENYPRLAFNPLFLKK